MMGQGCWALSRLQDCRMNIKAVSLAASPVKLQLAVAGCLYPLVAMLRLAMWSGCILMMTYGSREEARAATSFTQGNHQMYQMSEQLYRVLTDCQLSLFLPTGPPFSLVTITLRIPEHCRIICTELSNAKQCDFQKFFRQTIHHYK